MSERSFTIDSSQTKSKGGRFISADPGSAAKKAARRLFRETPKRQQIRFALRETTRGSDRGLFYYSATKSKLSSPIVVKRGDSEIRIEYSYDVKACSAF